MERDFWLERWEREEIGFHQNEVNPHLCAFWPALNLARGSMVFVPLCGKSQDMLWLREQGHAVLGVELSAIAAQAFFKENGYTPEHTNRGKFACCETKGIRILCGDFFDLCSDDLAQVSAVYDRAALIALPPEMRIRYVRHLATILPPATQILLIAVAYPQVEMQGPPFSVSSAEVGTLFGGFAEVHLLAETDVLEQNARFQQRGLSRLQEIVFRVKVR